MTVRFPLAVAFMLALAAPAAACPASMGTEIHGDANDVNTRASDCAQWGIYVEGDDNTLDGTVSGEENRVVSNSLGDGTHTSIDVDGFGNQLGTEVRGGGALDAVVRGDDNELALRAGDGSALAAEVVGSGNYVRGSAQ